MKSEKRILGNWMHFRKVSADKVSKNREKEHRVCRICKKPLPDLKGVRTNETCDECFAEGY